MPRSVDPPNAAGERIAKLLARAGVASRREVERMVAEGRVAHDGIVIGTPATLLPSLAGVTLDGQPVAAPEAARLFLYHKPVGLLVTERDPRGRPTIYDRLPRALPRLVPVGRLDLNTEGLLLLTTDGGLKRQLELPAYGVARTYRARVYGAVSQAQLEVLIEGIEIDGVRYGSIDANQERRTGANSWIELTLTEGKNREVRRVLEHLGLQVGRLIRTRYGPFVLGNLPADGVGEVHQADLQAFRRTLKERPAAPGAAREPQPSIFVAQPAASARRVPGADRATAAGRPRSPDQSRRSMPARTVEENAPSETKRRPAQPTPRPSPQLAPGVRHGGEKNSDAAPPRAAKLQRKPGWAKPKPRSGPSRPKRPR